MKVPHWIKPGAWGIIIGAAIVVVIGFSSFGWRTESSAMKMASSQSRDAVIEALVPICLAQAKEDPKFDERLVEFATINTWNRDDFVAKTGWATMPGSTEPSSSVASACEAQLSASIRKAG